MYLSTKKYDHNIGLSVCFRQWKAISHCRFLHGYALSFKFTFEAETLNDKNWVVDFGDLKGLKSILEANFDHRTLVAKNDPNYDWYVRGKDLGVLDLFVVEATGCEKIAELAYKMAKEYLKVSGYLPRVHLRSVEVSEHSGNSAIYEMKRE